MARGINPADLLSAIGDTDLRAFLRQEIRRNKRLAIRMSARFIAAVQFGDEQDKYSYLLGQILRTNTRGQIRLTARDTSMLNEVCQHLVTHAANLRAQAGYREAHELLKALIVKLHQFLDKQDNPDERIVHQLNDAYTELISLVLLTLAPELRTAICNYGMNLVATSYYRIYDKRKNMLSVLEHVMDDLRQQAKLIELLGQKLAAGDDTTDWAMWYYVMRARLGNPGSHAEAPEIPTVRQHGVAAALARMEALDALALYVREQYDNASINERQRTQWARWMYDIAFQRRDEHDTLEWGLELIRQSGDTAVFDSMVQVIRDADHPDALFSRILETGDLQLSGLLLAAQSRWNDLLTLVVERGALDLLTAHLEGLLSADASGTRKRIPGILMHFVTHNAGVQCGYVVNSFFQALRDSSVADMEKPLQTDLSHAFPGRFPITTSGVGIS